MYLIVNKDGVIEEKSQVGCLYADGGSNGK